MKKWLINLICILILLGAVGVVLALETTYNPFTGRLDYVLDLLKSDLKDTHTHHAYNITDEYWVNESGDTMTGNLNMSSANISIGTNNYLCLDNLTTCGVYITYNGTSSIWKVN